MIHDLCPDCGIYPCDIEPDGTKLPLCRDCHTLVMAQARTSKVENPKVFVESTPTTSVSRILEELEARMKTSMDEYFSRPPAPQPSPVVIYECQLDPSKGVS